ncbi:helix-turn-helix domain-containing protein [archaeon]|nr:helix-turn-helix domain-containing protein [archaeon]
MALDDMDEEVYSTIFNALRHGVRRNILRMLEDRELTHTEIAENLGISSSHLTYHLDALKDLVTKTENGYRLSRFGEAAVQMTKTVESPEPQVKPEDKKRLKNITMVLSISLLIIAGATIELYFLSSQQDKRVSNLGEVVDDIASKLDQYETMESILRNSSSIVLTNGRELSFKTDWIPDSLNPTRFIMIFYVPADNLTLCIETAVNKREGFYFPLTLQEGNVYTYSEYDNSSDVFQHPAVWRMNVTERFETIRVPLDCGWYSLSWVGPVSVHSDGSVDLYIDWGPRDMWVEADASLWSYCQLRYNGTATPFLVDNERLFSLGVHYSRAVVDGFMDG